MSHPIRWQCDICHQPVQGITGYLHVSVTDADARSRAVDAWEDAHPGVCTMADALTHPQLVHWHVHHAECDPEPESDDYWIPVSRISTYAQVLGWTAHLMEKNWLNNTDWPALLRTLDEVA